MPYVVKWLRFTQIVYVLMLNEMQLMGLPIWSVNDQNILGIDLPNLRPATKMPMTSLVKLKLVYDLSFWTAAKLCEALFSGLAKY